MKSLAVPETYRSKDNVAEELDAFLISAGVTKGSEVYHDLMMKLCSWAVRRDAAVWNEAYKTALNDQRPKKGDGSNVSAA